MNSIYPHDYREYLLEAYEIRSSKNPHYSMRAFARDLGIGASTLTEILKGKYGLSKARIQQIADRLHLSTEDKLHFSDLVEKKHGRNLAIQKQAAQRVRSRQKKTSQAHSLDKFKVISDWYHLAILEALELNNIKLSDLSKRLGLPQVTLTQALARLERLNLIQPTREGFEATENFSAFGEEVPSEYVRKLHRQMMEKAIQSLEIQPMQERENSSTVFSINRKDLPLAKKKMARFRREIASLLSKGNQKDDVYCLGIQFFSLLQRNHKI